MQADQVTIAAVQALERGNVPLAEIFARLATSASPTNATALTLLGRIAIDLGEHQQAADFFRRALQSSPNGADAQSDLSRAEHLARSAPAEGTDAWRREGRSRGELRGYLLSKAWGYGFSSDVNQVLGQLLLSEITGREPIIVWGQNSLFTSPGTDNAFPLYFQPPSALDPQVLLAPAHRYFPAKWTRDNLFDNDLNKWKGSHSRMGGILFLNRPEEVIVCDFHTSVATLANWLPTDHPMHGRDVESVYRYLAARYLKPAPEVQKEIDGFHASHMVNRRILAAHFRGTDKVSEVPHLATLNAQYRPLIDEAFAADPDLALFLLTDAQPTLDEFKARYPGRVIHTDCRRSSTQMSVHHNPVQVTDRRRLGVEVMRDIFLAARCDAFLGLGPSALSCLVGHLRDWPEGTFGLLGENVHLRLQPGVYAREA